MFDASLMGSHKLLMFQHVNVTFSLPHLRGSKQIHVVRVNQFVLKIEKLSHIIGARISRLTVSVPDYGSCLSQPESSNIFMYIIRAGNNIDMKKIRVEEVPEDLS